MTRRLLAPLLALTLLLVAGVVGGTVAADETVLITDQLAPALLTIDTGTTVTWTNRDDERHRMRSKDGPVRFDSQNLEPGESFSFTFTVEGTYPYYDHRGRDDAAYFGTIVVGGEALDPDAPIPDDGSVSIIDRSFRPPTITIAAGGTIEWTNDDGGPHTVTAADSTFDSGIVNGGGQFSQDFAEPGNYAYFCAIHPEMRGTVIVADRPEPADTEPEAADAGATVDKPSLDSALATLDVDELPGVSIVQLSFSPQELEVVVGETVTWSNDDTVGHTATAADGSFNTGIMAIGAEASIAFDAAGTFDYFCAIHPEMTATITVAEPGT